MNNKLIKLLVLAAFALATMGTAVAAVDDYRTTSSLWDVLGYNSSPVEKDNLVNTIQGEKGIILGSSGTVDLIPFVSAGAVLDTAGYDWNNKFNVGAGIKVRKNFESGEISLRTGAQYDDHFKSGNAKLGIVTAADAWFGWDKDERYPGSAWAEIGNTDTTEEGNIIGMAYVRQGVVAKRMASGPAIVPYVEATYAKDEASDDWNNKQVYGVGLELVDPTKDCGCQVGVSYQHEHRTISGISADGITLYAKLWFGH